MGGHLLWCLLIIVADFVTELLIPSPEFVAGWYLASGPLVYLVIAVFLVPITLTVATASSLIARRLGHRTTVALVIGISLWVLLTIAELQRGELTSMALGRSILTACIAVPALAVLVPLPARRTSQNEMPSAQLR